MSHNIHGIIQRVVAGSGDESDLQAIASALRSGQVVLATGDRSISIGGNVSKVVLNSSMNWNFVPIHTTSNSYLDSATPSQILSW